MSSQFYNEFVPLDETLRVNEMPVKLYENKWKYDFIDSLKSSF